MDFHIRIPWIGNILRDSAATGHALGHCRRVSSQPWSNEVTAARLLVPARKETRMACEHACSIKKCRMTSFRKEKGRTSSSSRLKLMDRTSEVWKMSAVAASLRVFSITLARLLSTPQAARVVRSRCSAQTLRRGSASGPLRRPAPCSNNEAKGLIDH